MDGDGPGVESFNLSEPFCAFVITGEGDEVGSDIVAAIDTITAVEVGRERSDLEMDVGFIEGIALIVPPNVVNG